MRAVRWLALGAGLVVSSHARAQPDPQALRDELTEALGVLLPGYADPADGPAHIARNGKDLLVEIPLKGTDTPLKAELRSEAGGAWTILSMSLPPQGTLTAGGGPARHYVIASQSIRGRLDPSLATPSAGDATLDHLRIMSDAGEAHTLQTIGRTQVRAELSQQSGGLLDLTSRSEVAGISLSMRKADTLTLGLDAASAMIKGELSGLEPAHLAVFRQKYAAMGGLIGGQPPSDWQARLRALLDAVPGTVDHIAFDQTARDLSLRFPGMPGLGIRQQHLTASAAARGDRVDAALTMDAEDVSAPSMQAEFAAFLPHHLHVRPVLTELPAIPLEALAQAALTPGADPAELRQQAFALLQTPGAAATIESISFDAGPLSVHGSGKLRPTASGQLGGALQLRARGVDALLAQAQGNPKLQQFIVPLFLAKGMGRLDGDALVWDISFGDGMLTVNGVPFGQPSTRKP